MKAVFGSVHRGHRSRWSSPDTQRHAVHPIEPLVGIGRLETPWICQVNSNGSGGHDGQTPVFCCHGRLQQQDTALSSVDPVSWTCHHNGGVRVRLAPRRCWRARRGVETSSATGAATAPAAIPSCCPVTSTPRRSKLPWSKSPSCGSRHTRQGAQPRDKRLGPRSTAGRGCHRTTAASGSGGSCRSCTT
jgi:hypothetical protein